MIKLYKRGQLDSSTLAMYVLIVIVILAIIAIWVVVIPALFPK